MRCMCSFNFLGLRKGKEGSTYFFNVDTCIVHCTLRVSLIYHFIHYLFLVHFFPTVILVFSTVHLIGGFESLCYE